MESIERTGAPKGSVADVRGAWPGPRPSVMRRAGVVGGSRHVVEDRSVGLCRAVGSSEHVMASAHASGPLARREKVEMEMERGGGGGRGLTPAEVREDRGGRRGLSSRGRLNLGTDKGAKGEG